MKESFSVPILFLFFNRPDTTQVVFEQIRLARPNKLYLASDGPRASRAAEAEIVERLRALILSQVDWPCEVKTLFRDHNLGCKKAVSGAINWFFENEPEGIILEDDVVPTESFFPYCEELLERYRDDERVMVISGCNLVSQYTKNMQESYFFSEYNHVWGWASWRRAWQHYDVTMSDWPRWKRRLRGGLSLSGILHRLYWRRNFQRTFDGKVDTWDFQWLFTCWRKGGLTALPRENQTTNIGFGNDATHTMGEVPAYIKNSPALPLAFPLSHPASVVRDAAVDRMLDRKAFGLTLPGLFSAILRKLSR